MRQSLIGLMLTSWLFTLTLCAFGVDAHESEASEHTAAHTHDHDHDHPGPHGGSGADGLCCDVLQAHAVPTDTGAAPAPAFEFTHSVIPTTALDTSCQTSVTTQHRFTHPPNSADTPTRIANFLWPNAPPHHLA